MENKNENTKSDDVQRRLEEFVSYFVKEFETKLYAYNMILEGEMKKAGRFSDSFSGVIGQLIGGSIGGAIGLGFKSIPTGIKIGANVGKAAGEKIGNVVGNKKHSQKIVKLSYLIELFRRDKAHFRRKLIGIGFDIFQSFEAQFSRVTTHQGDRVALKLLARDAVNRILNYCEQKKDCLITEAVISGKSKVEAILGVTVPTSKLRTPGFEITYVYKSEQKWYTSNLYESVGLVFEGKTVKDSRYYEKKCKNCKVEKYGFRRMFTSENWKTLKNDYRLALLPNKRDEFCNYEYILKPENIEQKTNNIFDAINNDDTKLTEERTKKILEEAKYEIIECFKREGRDRTGDRQLLKDIEAKIRHFDIEECMKSFEEIKNQQNNMEKSIKKSIEENLKCFNRLDKKQDDYHNDIRNEQKMIQKQIESNDEKLKDIRHAVLIKDKSELKPVWFNLKTPTELFSGRRQELDDLHKKVLRSYGKPTVISQITSISGLGGIGKTELSRQYAYEFGNIFENNIIGINAESEDALSRSFVSLAADVLKISTKNANGIEKDLKIIIDEVYRFFRKKKCLFIFDNAERFDNFDLFLPLRCLTADDNKPFILITSRYRDWGRGIEVMYLDKLEIDEAVELVRKGLAFTDIIDIEIKQLVEILQRFPLAIMQSIAYIRSQHEMREYGIVDYLKELDEKTKELLDSGAFMGLDNDYSKTTFTTWRITKDKILADEQYGTLALQLLDITSYLASENIERKLFNSLSEDKDLLVAVHLLSKYSMVNSENRYSIFNIHRLVQQVTRLEISGREMETNVIKTTFEILQNNFPHGSDKLEDFGVIRSLLPHIETFSTHLRSTEKLYLVKLLIWLGHGYYIIRNPRRQMEVLERALEIQKIIEPEENLKYATIMSNLAVAYSDLGVPTKQKELLERVIKIQEKYFDIEDNKLAETMGQLAIAEGNIGNHLTKKRLLHSVLNIQEKSLGFNHTSVAITLANLGNTYGVLGDLHKKIELLEKALEIQVKHYGPEHFLIATTLGNLSNAYGDLGKYELKKMMLEKALRIVETAFGAEHFEVARFLGNLANAYGDLGDPNKKKELIERALKIQKIHYGSDHYIVAKSLVNLGNSYGQLGQPEMQKELLLKALVIYERYYDSNHFEIAKILLNLGNAWRALGNVREMKRVLEKALKIQERHFGSEHHALARTLELLGCAFGDLGDFLSKKQLIERALNVKEKYFGPNHVEIYQMLVTLGNAYGELGDYEKQKELQEKSISRLEEHYGIDHYEVAVALVNVSNAYGELGEHDKQKIVLKRAISLLENHYGPEHVFVASALVNLSTAYKAFGNHLKQKELLEKALKIQEKRYNSNHFEIAITLVNLGQAYGQLGDQKTQIKLLERALEIQRNQHGHANLQIVTTIECLSVVYSELENHQKLKELLDSTLPFLEKYYGSEQVQLVPFLVNLGNASGILGESKKRIDLLERAMSILEKNNFIHSELIPVILHLSNAYEEVNDHGKQLALLERYLPVLEAHGSDDSFNTAVALSKLGHAYETLGNHHKQIYFLERALPLLKKHCGLGDSEVIAVLMNLSHAYKLINNQTKCIELLEDVLALLEKHYGSDHPEFAQILINLDDAYDFSGEVEKRVRLIERTLPLFEKCGDLMVGVLLSKLEKVYELLKNSQERCECLQRATMILQKYKKST